MSLKYLKIRKISILFFLVFLSCKVTDNYTGVWVSTDSYLYKNTKVEFFDNNRVIMSNLPQNGYIFISSNPQDAFDSSIKECLFDKKENRIWYNNFSNDVFAEITFITSKEMVIVFSNGTICNFEKQ